MIRDTLFFCIWLVFFGIIVLEILSPGYTIRLLVSLDIVANVLAFGEVETISARLGESEANGNWFAARACDVLDWFDPQHCEKAAGLITSEASG